MPSLRLVILISGSGSNLQAIIDSCAAPGYEASISAVISNKPGVRGLERASEAGIATHCIEHQGFASREAFDAALIEQIDAYRPDLLVLAGFMRILTPGFVNHYHGRLLNIHPSLLPKYPGLHTHQRALDAGDSEAGATVHFVTEELDGGPPIVHARVPIVEGDDAQSLAARVLQQEHKIYPLAVHWMVEGRLQLADNKAILDGQPLDAQGYDATND